MSDLLARAEAPDGVPPDVGPADISTGGRSRLWRRLIPVAVCAVVALLLVGVGWASGRGPVVAGHEQDVRILTTSTPLGQGASRLARISGRLTVDSEGCLFLTVQDSPNPVGLVWPGGFSASRTTDGTVLVRDDAGRTVIREGQVLTAGGGGITPPAGPCARRFDFYFGIGSHVSVTD